MAELSDQPNIAIHKAVYIEWTKCTTKNIIHGFVTFKLHDVVESEMLSWVYEFKITLELKLE